MALTTYTELKAAIATQLSRSDLTSYIVDAITLVEAKVNRVLQDPNQHLKTTVSTSSEYNNLPTANMLITRLQLNTSTPHPLDLYSPGYAAYLTDTTGEPYYYTLENNQIRLIPAPDTTYTVEIGYFRTVPVLSGSNATNWLLTSHPDIYLYGACFECCVMLRDVEGAQGYKMIYDNAVNDLERLGKKQRWAGNPMATRPG